MLSVKAKRFNLGSIRAENLVSHSLRVLQVLSHKHQVDPNESLMEEKLLSGHSD